jgi:hypothetical protein
MLAGVHGNQVCTKTVDAEPETEPKSCDINGSLRHVIVTCCTMQAAAVMFMSAARMLAAGPVPSTSSLRLQKARICCSFSQCRGAVRAHL